MVTKRIYITCTSGFGNRVFEMITCVYLHNLYQGKVSIQCLEGHSKHRSLSDPLMGDIFPNLRKIIHFIKEDEFRRIKPRLCILSESSVPTLDSFPTYDSLQSNTRVLRVYHLAFLMYNTFNERDKDFFDMNLQLIDNHWQQIASTKYVAVHVRYGDKVSVAKTDFFGPKKESFPLATPQFYIDVINKLLVKGAQRVLLLTDSVPLVEKYIMCDFNSNSKVKLIDTHWLNAFYLLCHAHYIVLSHSTFSFAAAYLNPTAHCLLLAKHRRTHENQMQEDVALDPKWTIVRKKQYVLNYDRKQLWRMNRDLIRSK